MRTFKALIENSTNTGKVKYEMCPQLHELVVDRFIEFDFPCEYGYLPNTLAKDGDALDVIVVSPQPLKVTTLKS